MHMPIYTCTHTSELRPCLDGRMVRRRYSSMGVFYGVVQQYDYFGDGTGGYLVNFNDGDSAHLSADEIDACLLSRHDQLAYCERRLHPDPTTSWTGVAPPVQVPTPALSGTKRPNPTQQVASDGMQLPEDGHPRPKKTRAGKSKRGNSRHKASTLHALTRGYTPAVALWHSGGVGDTMPA